MGDRLTALDATFLELEELDEGALMSIGGAMVFDPLPGGGVPTVDEVRSNLGGRLGSLPRYTQRLSATRHGSWAWPHWMQDERFEIANHVGHAALPGPGGEQELCDWLADFFSHPLDRRRPLWEMVLIEGLEHGRWAIGNKTHHCLVDGVGSVDVVDLLLDSEPSPDGRVAHEPARGEGRPVGLCLPDVSEPLIQAAQAGANAASAGVHAVLHPKDAFERSRALAELIVRDEVIGAPQTSLSVPIGCVRRFAVVRVPLAELKAIGRQLGSSLNDVVLASCASGLRRLLIGRGEEIPRRGLRAMVPMNLRDTSGKLALGNRVTSLFVDLPVAEVDPTTRLQRIAASTKHLRQSGAAAGATVLMDLAAMAPPVAVRAALARTEFTKRLFSVTITNVPGPQKPLYAFGAQLTDVYPVVPLAADHAVGIAIFSYNGMVTFGINADCSSTPDLDVLTHGIEDGLDELRALVHTLDEPPRK
jgi:diacylglycerol O-acyltransferase / wax synthase